MSEARSRGRSPLSIALFSLFWAGLALVCARYDLAVSRALVDATKGWARFGERFGELPGVYAFALAGALCYARPQRAEARSLLGAELPWLICCGGVATMIALSAYRLFDYRFGAAAGTVCLLLVVTFTRLARRRLGAGIVLPPRVDRTCTWTVRLTVYSWLLVSTLKLGWGRIRYRDLAPLGQDFTPWYAPQGWTGHESFPSGHAASSWLLLPCLLLWPRGSARFRLAFALSFAWGAFVCASRVVIGAHYLSDVLFSTAFAFGVMAYAFALEKPQGAQRARVDGDASSPEGK